MIHLYLVFQFVKGRCHGNQLILGKCHERRLIPLAVVALSFQKELQYHSKNVGRGDVATSCRNLVNFCRVTPEITGLICYLGTCTCIWRKSTYRSAFVMLPFRNAMEHLSALTAAINRYKFGEFLINISRIHAYQTVYNRQLVYLRSLGGSTVMYTTTC